MKQVSSFEEFLSLSQNKTSLLFIKEQGCFYCEAAEKAIIENNIEAIFKTIGFYQITIEDDPYVSSRLRLIGVPAFFKIDKHGSKRLKTGFIGIADFVQFLSDV